MPIPALFLPLLTSLAPLAATAVRVVQDDQPASAVPA